MEKKITGFLPISDKVSIDITVSSLKNSGVFENIYVLINDGKDHVFSGITAIKSNGFASTLSIKRMSEAATTDFILIYSKSFRLDLGKFALNRMMQVCEDTGAGLVYSDYFENKE